MPPPKLTDLLASIVLLALACALAYAVLAWALALVGIEVPWPG
jgi:hypothetical protein